MRFTLPRRGLFHLAAAGLAAKAEAATPTDTGHIQGGAVDFPSEIAPSERPIAQPPIPLPPGERVGFAVIGLGRLALENILPAFAQSKRARLTALVSGSPDKARTVAAQYGVPAGSVYDYAGFDRIRDNPDVQAVYIVLPNALHAEYTRRAAAAGKHVLCEKPMAVSSAECEAMIAACKQADRRLMIAYRCQYEPYNRDVLGLVRNQALGPARFFDAVNFQTMNDAPQWRFDKTLAGGGALPDVGLYCLNGVRFMTGEEPVEVFARTYSTPGDPRFAQVEETVSFTLRFPSGTIANCAASYGLHEARPLQVHAPAGWIRLDNAFAYAGHALQVAHRDGQAESIDARHLTEHDQFALELDHMADCVRTGATPHTPGEEGLQDQRIMEAIYHSAATGQLVTLPPVSGLDTTRGPAPGPV